MMGQGIDGIESLTEACERCWRGSGMPAKRVAAELGIDYTAFVRMFNRNDPRHFPPDKILPLMVLCGSVLPLEWQAAQMGYALHHLELTEVLVAIRDVLLQNGAPAFRVCESGRLEPPLE